MKKTLENWYLCLLKFLNTLFNLTNKLLVFVVKYPLLILLFLFACSISILVLLVKNNTNVGGLLGLVWSWLSNSPESPLEVANSIPADRIQMIGEKDSQGFIQHKVSELPSSLNPFRDKTQITLPSGKKVKLPDGIKDTDIDVVIQMKTEIIIVPFESNKIQVQDSQKLVEDISQVNSSAEELLQKLKTRQNL